ncbi:MAG: hypothetical protein H7222_18270 [Methylotenera sp.]|nr:hypothetical protein [Oligoflexia bacterium]
MKNPLPGQFTLTLALSVACALFIHAASAGGDSPSASPRFEPIPRASGRDEVIPQVDRYLRARYGILPGCSSEALQSIREALDLELRSARKDQRGTDEAFIQSASERLAKVSPHSCVPGQWSLDLLVPKRIFYSMISEELTTPKSKAAQLLRKSHDFLVGLDRDFKLLERLVLKSWAFSVPMGSADMKREATNLHRDGKLLNPTDLSELSVLELSKLSPDPAHPMWSDERQPRKEADLTAKLEKSVSHALSLRSGRPISYQFTQADHVLFFERIKETNTSAKILVKDALGVAWKMKWGIEAQTEPVAQSLILKLGARFAQPVFSNGSTDEVVLILPALPAGSTTSEAGTCKAPAQASTLNECLKRSIFQFNLAPYVRHSGKITADNLSSVLKLLPRESRIATGAASARSLIGRSFVTFHESSVRFEPMKGVMLRKGAVPLSSLGALEDRVTRGLIVFNFWIENLDPKEDNTKNYLISNFSDEHSGIPSAVHPEYVEAQYDLGASLGGFISQGSPNDLKTGKDFISIRSILGKKRIFFKAPMAFYSKAWRRTTYADALWMARKITELSRGDIETAVALSKWADIGQKAWVYKLIERRNGIAEVFNLPLMNNPAPSFSVSLETDREIREVAAHYGISESLILAEIERAGLDRTGLRDELLKAGTIADCSESILIGILERTHYPSGLSRRIGRYVDSDLRERGCHLGDSPRPKGFLNLLSVKFRHSSEKSLTSAEIFARDSELNHR